MRCSILLLMTSTYVVNGAWVRWSNGRDLVGRAWSPRETGMTSTPDDNGWTPKPTAAPGQPIPDSKAVLELFRRKEAKQKRTTNTWVDESTCGWFSGSSSDPYTCTSGYTCATNNENVVGCVSGTYSPFFTVCLDYEAYQKGACASIGPQTGCCQSSGFGACGTFLWDEPLRSMYRCFPQQTVISMLDEPHSNSSGGNHTGAIVGGIVGGVAGLALIGGAVAFFLLRNPRRYNAIPNHADNTGYHPSGAGFQGYSLQQQQPLPSPGTTGTGAVTTFPPTSPYPAAPGYDSRQSYYDPGKQPLNSPPPQYTYHAAAAAAAGGGGGLVSPPLPAETTQRHSIMSELDSGNIAAGLQGNPAEMPATPR
ncbi:hypothetical protein QBC46DRAFT_432870 [Diplogelasinospora grovesii]|uniref:Uncharacterized protein n=1 Tax=Diplogelasinospora grovesii TaxID=303347 RepID=A0AAN6NC28_9PEZI|nr:hypothetical protein QBC46DRAFT_432870 [Diplogelasinospora grovesii]